MTDKLVERLGEPRDTYSALTKQLLDVGCTMNVHGYNAIWDCLKANADELERLREAEGDANEVIEELENDNQALREKLERHHTFIWALSKQDGRAAEYARNHLRGEALREIEATEPGGEEKG